MAKYQKEIRFFIASKNKIVMKGGDEILPIEMENGSFKRPLLWEHRKKLLQFYVDDTLWFVAKTLSQNDASPPSSALLSALLPSSTSEDVIENLGEIFREKWVVRHGLRTARRIWRIQAALIVVQHWLSPIWAFLDRIKELKTGH